jgi:hypothetical protein
MKPTFAVLPAVLLAFAASAAAQPDLRGWSVGGDAPHIVLDGVEETESGFVLKLRNAYSATAMEIAFASQEPGPDPTESTLSWYSDVRGGIAPGAVYPLRMTSAAAATHPDRVLHIAAAMFEDGFAEGDAGIVRQATFDRVGTMLEHERIRTILDAVDGGHAGNAQLAEIRKRLGDLPRTVEAAFAAVGGIALPGLPVIDPEKAAAADARARAGLLAGVGAAREEIFRSIGQLERLPETSAPGDPPTMLPPEAGRTRSGYLSYLRRLYDERSAKYREWGAHHTFSIFGEDAGAAPPDHGGGR